MKIVVALLATALIAAIYTGIKTSQASPSPRIVGAWHGESWSDELVILDWNQGYFRADDNQRVFSWSILENGMLEIVGVTTMPKQTVFLNFEDITSKANKTKVIKVTSLVKLGESVGVIKWFKFQGCYAFWPSQNKRLAFNRACHDEISAQLKKLEK